MMQSTTPPRAGSRAVNCPARSPPVTFRHAAVRITTVFSCSFACTVSPEYALRHERLEHARRPAVLAYRRPNRQGRSQERTSAIREENSFDSIERIDSRVWVRIPSAEFEEFVGDHMRLDAAVPRLITIGEAVKYISVAAEAMIREEAA